MLAETGDELATPVSQVDITQINESSFNLFYVKDIIRVFFQLQEFLDNMKEQLAPMEDDLRDARRRVTAAKGPKKDKKGGGKGKAPEPKDDEIPSEDDQENGQSDESDWVDSKCYSGCCSHTSPFRQLYQETWRLFLKCLNGIVWHMFQSGIDLGKHIVSKLADLLFWEHVFGFCCNQHAPIMYRSQSIEERLYL